MQKYLQFFIFPLILSSPVTHANIESFVNPEAEELVDQSTLSSIPHLISLKNLNNTESYQSPFVQELTNPLNVRTLFVSTHDLPIVDIQITFNAGSAQDEKIGKGLFGIANMAAKLMSEGTDQYSAKQLNSAFNELGAKYSVHAYRDMFTIHLRVRSDPNVLYPALDLFLHLINHANFNQSGLNLVLNNTKVGQKQLQENPSRLMNIKFYRALYGQHPYAEPTVGTQASIRKITPELIRKFRDQLLVAQNSNIAITGNLTTIQANQIAHKISQTLPQGVKVQPLEAPIQPTGFNIHWIPHQSSQAHVIMGYLGIKRNQPDRIALEVANRIFGGGGFNSLLSKELRIKRGFTYNASSTLTSTQTRGLFSLSYATQQEQLLESIDVAHQTLYDFIHQPLTRKQLAETKEGMLRALPMSLSSNASINAQIAAIGFYGMNTDYLNQYQKQIANLTTKDVEQAIKKHLHANQMTIVIVSNQFDKNKITDILNKNIGIQTVTQNNMSEIRDVN